MTPGEQIAKEIRELINMKERGWNTFIESYEDYSQRIDNVESYLAELIDKALEK